MYKYAFSNIHTVEADSRAGYSTCQAGECSQRCGECSHLAFDITALAANDEFSTDINTALLLTNRQIFDEAEPILYQTRFIHIGVYLRTGLEFLEGLSPRARRNIRAVHIELSHEGVCGLGYPFEFGHRIEDWCKLCDYMSQNLQLRALSFNVSLKEIPANFADQIWVKHLIKIRELKLLVQRNFTDMIERASSDGGSDSWPEPGPGPGPEPEPEPESEQDQVLNSRLQALLSYLRSKMCRLPASRLLTETDDKWDWVGARRRFLMENEEQW